MKRALKALLVLVIVAAVGGIAIACSILNHGISAKTTPTWMEEKIAGTMRHLAIPRAERARANPVAAAAESINAGLEHFADHCAICHANDGAGDTEIGRNLYPKPPDMRAAATQALSDGELFYIIENGVRLTGMPAWSTGTAEGERESWRLVHFIRHLPKLSQEELARMKELNPKSPAEFQEEERINKFLEGEDAAPSPSSPSHRHPNSGEHP
jgi:mono/diheme cytochrome c family protein